MAPRFRDPVAASIEAAQSPVLIRAVLVGSATSLYFFLSDESSTGPGPRRRAALILPLAPPPQTYMCPACITSTAVMVAGAGSTGGILAVCIGGLRKFLQVNRLGLFQKTKEK